jgi:hypothetical protein
MELGMRTWMIVAVLGSLFVSAEFDSLIARSTGAAADWISIVLFCFLVWTAYAFKKNRHRPQTLMDALVHVTTAGFRASKPADLERAVTLAHEDLLQEQVALADVQNHATALAKGPMPYSTHDLASAAALAFFRNPQYQPLLAPFRTAACIRVANWANGDKVNPLLAGAFQETLGRVTAARNAAKTEPAPPDPITSQSYNDRVLSFLAEEFGPENGNILANHDGVRRIVKAYEADGLAAEQAAHYLALKLKWGPKDEAEMEIQKEVAAEFVKHGTCGRSNCGA